MALTFYRCKASNKEEAAFAQEVNTLAHDCSKELEKLISQYKKNVGDTLYKPIEPDGDF
jgi:hypothetical protein